MALIRESIRKVIDSNISKIIDRWDIVVTVDNTYLDETENYYFVTEDGTTIIQE